MARLSEAEIKDMKPQVPDWEVITEEGMSQLHRVFTFANFAEALAFTNRVGELAEAADHHPRLVTEWGRVAVTWWSHQYGGIVAEDAAMARKIDAL